MEKVTGRDFVHIHYMKEYKYAVWCMSAAVRILGASLSLQIHKIHRFTTSGMVTSNKEQQNEFY